MINSKRLIELANEFGAHNYHPLPVVLTRGQGDTVWDVEGKEYLDFLSCYSALNFGHAHPKMVATLQAQAEKLSVCSRAFFSEELSLFTRDLAHFCGMDRVLPMNSGTEAVETAIKIARKWGYEIKKVAPDQANIIVMEDNFHGRSITVISFSTEVAYRDGFSPYTPGFKIVKYGDLKAVENAVDKNTVGVLVEPIQAEAGILIPPAGYLKGLSELCAKKNILLMLDEIQTGFGRTGKDFCYQYEIKKPDMLILGKSLGGGLLPISAVVSKSEIMDVIKPGQHGSTFGGNPLACAVARKAIEILRDEDLSQRSQALGQLGIERLKRLRSPFISEIRGRGLLVGIELKAEAGGARKYCERIMENGVLCKETHVNVIRMAPPLIISEANYLKGIDKIAQVLENPPD